jgi:hypothetical protein
LVGIVRFRTKAIEFSYTPSSEPFRIYSDLWLVTQFLKQLRYCVPANTILKSGKQETFFIFCATENVKLAQAAFLVFATNLRT